MDYPSKEGNLNRVPGADAPKNIYVVHVATEKGWRGGERQALLLMEGLHKRGISQTLITPANTELASRVAEGGFAELVLLKSGSRYRPENWRRLRRTVRALQVGGQKREIHPIIHAHTSHGHALAWLAGPKKVPVVITRRVDFAPGKGISRGARYTNHRMNFIALSEVIRDQLASVGVPPERLHIVPSGIDTRRFAEADDKLLRAQRRRALREAWGVEENTLILLNVGALTDHKGQRYLLEALAKLKGIDGRRVLCLIAGEGELREELQRKIERLGLGTKGGETVVRLLGFQSDVAGLMAAADLYVHPSTLEGLGTSIIDAMYMRLPIISSKVGGITDLLDHEKSALLTAPGDVEGLTNALDRNLRSGDLRARLGAGSREAFDRGAFRAQDMVEGTLAVYKGLVPESSSASA